MDDNSATIRRDFAAERALKTLTQASPQLASVSDGVQLKLKQVSEQLNNHAASANQAAFAQLKALAEGAVREGPVLFISERHLVTFHQINVPLVPEYELVTLMEMAMSNNQVYLQQFYADLRNHRFAAIVAGKQNVGLKEEGLFADENNVWNARVSPYILCYYEPNTEIDTNQSKIEFYLPRTEPVSCP